MSRRCLAPIIFALVSPLLAAPVTTPTPAPSPIWKMPTWPEKIAEGVMPPEGFPESRAENEEEATAGLKAKIEALCQQTDAALRRETDDFVKATKNGSDKAKTRRLAAQISERLKAQPESTPFGSGEAPTSSPTPSPRASPTAKIPN